MLHSLVQKPQKGKKKKRGNCERQTVFLQRTFSVFLYVAQVKLPFTKKAAEQSKVETGAFPPG